MYWLNAVIELLNFRIRHGKFGDFYEFQRIYEPTNRKASMQLWDGTHIYEY